jgi:hypothetical protein
MIPCGERGAARRRQALAQDHDNAFARRRAQEATEIIARPGRFNLSLKALA